MLAKGQITVTNLDDGKTPFLHQAYKMKDGRFLKHYPVYEAPPVSGYKEGDLWHWNGEDYPGRNYFNVSLGSTSAPKNIQLYPNATYTASTNLPNRSDGGRHIFFGEVGFSANSFIHGVSLGNPLSLTTDSSGVIQVKYSSWTSTWIPSGVYNVKLEKGTTATPWSPAPEDLTGGKQSGYFVANKSNTTFDFNDWTFYADELAYSDSDKFYPKFEGTYSDYNEVASDDQTKYTWKIIQADNVPSITTVSKEYYLSTSNTSTVGGTWSEKIPPWTTGKFYWSRMHTIFADGTIKTSTPVLDEGLNLSLVTTLEVKATTQTLSTTVSQQAGQIALKANTTDVNTLTGRVTKAEGSITTIAGQVALKANSSDVNTLTGRVTTAEGSITTQAGQIALKANQSVVDTLTGRVSTTEAKITATDGKVNTLTTKTDGNTTQIGLLQTGYDGLSSTVTALETGKVGNEAFSALEQNLSGFKTTVQNTYADKTTVTQLSTQWTTTTNLVNGHTTQIASLGTDINLRATKADLIAQINLSPETILIASKKVQIKGDTYIESGVIKTAHIADLAVSGAKIANASIASAKIISLDANKITANTLSAITTNTGALNVSGNLTMMTDNTLITGHYEYSDAYNAYEPRTFVGNFYLGRRYIEFRGDTWEYKNGNIKNSFLGFNETFYGQDYLKLRTYDNSVSRNLLSRIDMYNGRLEMGKSFSETNLYLNNEGVVYGKQLIGERMETNRIDFRGLATFVINEKKEHNLPTLRMTAAEEAIFSIESPSPQKANLYLGGDTSPRIWSGAFYSRTYPSAANVVVTDQGTIGRAVSAAKYKTNISILYSTIKNAKQVLKIQPKTWWDKRALEETGKIREGYGYIADEFHYLGLTEVVQYDSLGEIEGLAYDRISMYHNVILQDHEQQLKRLDSINSNVIELVANDSIYGLRLNNLESEVFRLKKRIEELEKIA